MITGRACGRELDECSLNHAVLQLEQMMSTGGGWQDQVKEAQSGGWVCQSGLMYVQQTVVVQAHVVEELMLMLYHKRRCHDVTRPFAGWQVGGLVGGVKIGRSPASLPLRVEVNRLEMTTETRQALEDHLVLIYTGKQVRGHRQYSYLG